MKPLLNVSMYRKQLPKPLIPFASNHGKRLFSESLSEGNMENFFELSEQFVTQSRPEDCAVSSLVMVLNSLGIDPGKQWKGPWRWFSEDILNCVRSSENGFSLSEFLSLARCNKTWGMCFYTSSEKSLEKTNLPCESHSFKILQRSISLNSFRSAILAGCRQSKFYVVVNNSRKALAQSGEGHYSPIAGYNEQNDMCLILDVARFKYPSYWCPVSLLYEALDRTDPVSLKSRGFVCVSRSVSHFSEICARPMDTVSLSKVTGGVGIDMLKNGEKNIFPVVFRLFYDLYEKFEENEIQEEIDKCEHVEINKSLEELIDELNPDVKNAKRLLTSAVLGPSGLISKEFRKKLGFLI